MRICVGKVCLVGVAGDVNRAPPASLAVPDISIDGCLSATHVMLDKMQLELIKGLLAMNLGEDIEEFEKPSTLIHDPVSQVRPITTTITLLLLLHCIL